MIAFGVLSLYQLFLLSMSLMKKIALPIAVANAHPFVKEHALLVTENIGGNGAVREVCDSLIK